jgi:hypothetical protein
MQQKYAPMLFLPSLLSDEFINIANIQQEEAVALVGFFDSQVAAKRRLGHNPNPVAELLEEFKGNLNLEALVEDTSIEELVETLTVSNLPKQRGRRALFLDVENDVIAIGTTVVYNQNWAMRGVTDPTVLTTVLDAVAEAA